ncbi:hypothetical protein E5A73_20570 [Sphingomonas gei]|uniref:Uncharacterized protein n=1 Tax=Sphingomonas gei TaxID=1395960 RepID=A0A4V6RB85_9SPHN|nr:hypothetical protein [Sphingomonas gei]TGX48702.1 hypothetical protein E5A73_20570 [Sphingomonas gei]
MIAKFAVAGLVSALGLSTLFWLQPAGTQATAPPPAAPSSPVAATPSQATSAAVMLPARLLECRLGRITNFDPSREQKPSEFKYEGSHPFVLFLPPIPVRTAEPPRSTLPPEPVDPRTRIVADPDGISAGAAGRPFERVVDYWPERVEMTTPAGGGAVNMIILQQSEAMPGLIDMFMTRATDAVTWDQAHLYSGQCKLAPNGAAPAL